jgi:hypothetical protein
VGAGLVALEPDIHLDGIETGGSQGSADLVFNHFAEFFDSIAP